jgi:hypothetical protein
MESIPLFRIGQKLSASIVQKDNVKFLRSIHFARLTRSVNHRVIASQLLSATGSRKHREKERQIAEPR